MVRYSRACALVAIVLAAVAVWTWGADLGQLLAFSDDQKPISPSNALCLLAWGLLVHNRGRMSSRGFYRQTSLVIALVLGGFGVFVGLRPWFNWNSPLEVWLAHTTDRIGGVQVGQMSAVSGGVLVLVALIYWLQAFSSSRRSWTWRLSAVLTTAIVLLGLAVLVPYAAGHPWSIEADRNPVALWTGIIWLFLGVALLGYSPQARPSPAGKGEAARSEPWSPYESRARAFAILIASTAALSLSVVTALYLRQENVERDADARQLLTAVESMKLEQIANWRRERLNDARFFAGAEFTSRDVEAFLGRNDSPRTRDRLVRWLDLLKGGERYSLVALVDTNLHLRLAIPHQTNSPTYLQHLVSDVARANELTISDVHGQSGAEARHIDIVLPIHARTNSSRMTPVRIGSLLLRVDPRNYLYPLLQTWPYASRSAESIILRRDGEGYVFCSPTRFGMNTDAKVQFPITADLKQPGSLPEGGRQGQIKGRDYRDVPVFAELRQIPDSDWYLLTKVDREEVLGMVKAQAWVVLGLTLIATVGAGLLVGFVARREEARHTRQQLAVERERLLLAQRVEYLMKHANDAILLADEHDRIVEVNERVTQAYGYAPGELQGMKLEQLRAPEARANFARESAAVLAAGKAVFQTLHRRKDGTVFPVEISSNVVELDGRLFKLGILRDITERKAHEREIERLNRLYATLSEMNQSIVRIESREELFRNVCRIAVEVGGFKLAWVGWPEPGNAQIRPVACAGAAADQLDQIRVFVDDRPEGGGLVGQCFRSGKTFISHDVTTDPRTVPWQPLVRAHGLRGAAALPVQLRGVVRGVFTVYVGEATEFQDREIALLEELALDISWGLEQLERRASHEAAERALRDSEELYRTLIAASPNAITLTDLAGRTLFTSSRALAMFGEAPGTDLTGRSVLEWVAPEERERAQQNARNLPGEGSLLETEYTMLRKDGSRFFGEVTVGVFRGGDGSPKGKIIVTRDISERKRAEAALRESETRLSAIFNHSPVGIVMTRLPEGRIVDVNPAFAALHGYARAEMIGRTPLELQLWAEPDARTKLYANLRAPGDREQLEMQACTRSGTIRELQISIQLIELSGELFSLGLATDVTERKQLEVALRHQAMLAREAGEIAHVGGWEFDPVTLVGDWTEEAARIHDLERGTAITVAEALEFYRGESRARIEAALKEAVEKGTPFDLELEILSVQGRTKWVRSICHPVVENGKVLRVRGSYQGITERKRREQHEQLHLRTLQLLATGAVLPEVLESIVTLLECAHPDWCCAIMLLDESGRHLVHGAAARLPEFYLQEVNGIAITPSAGSCGAAAATKQLVVVEDIETHPYWDDFREVARRAGLRACWSQPILSPDNDVLGTMALYHSKPRVPTWEEVNAITAISGLASIAIAQRRAETALRASEERFRGLYENSSVGIYRTTPDGRILLANPALVKLLGYDTAAELVERQLNEASFEPRYSRQQFLAEIERTGEIRGLEAAWKRRDGTMIFVRESARAVRDDAGRTLYYDGVVEDVTQRKQAEDQLRKLSRAVEQSSASIVITDRQGRIEYINPHFTEVTGYTLAEVVGQNPRVLKSGETSPEQYQELWQTITQGREWRGEFHNKRKNGETLWESASVSPVLDEAGRITHFVAVKEDITERKRLEAQFRQAQKMEAVGQLAGGVAHDFNNILGAIMLHLGLLRDVPNLDPFLAGSLRELETEAKRAAGLTRQLLQFSRRSVLQVQPLDLNEVVENLLKMLRRLIGEQINLDWYAGSDLPAVSADIGMVEQVLMNLVVNARDAMPNGGSLVLRTQTVRLDETDVRGNPDARTGEFVQLSVADSGCGMSEAIQKRIFEPFFTTKETGKGTGLGLATVYGIVRQHQGWVSVESVEGQGSTFQVYFPPVPKVRGETIAPVAAPIPRGSELILLLEDEHTLRVTAARFLRGCGYRVLEAADCLEALRLWEDHAGEVALLLTDMVVPGEQNGLQLAQELRGRKPGLKVLLTSGYSAELVGQNDLAGIGISFLPKPSAPDALARAVRNTLDGGLTLAGTAETRMV